MLGKIFHGHDLDHQACPPCEVLRALTSPRLRVVLLPSEARVNPALVHRLHKILAELRVQLPRLLAERSLMCRHILI